jgi:hypothetical protein
MAEMLTPVDYSRSSTVWASDKWKGVFKVRWIFVRDIPNAQLRHIRLQYGIVFSQFYTFTDQKRLQQYPREKAGDQLPRYPGAPP